MKTLAGYMIRNNDGVLMGLTLAHAHDPYLKIKGGKFVCVISGNETSFPVEVVEEMIRQLTVRTQALQKLNSEERELLGWENLVRRSS